jgi:2-hydroxychromene-2-carboxylate isomerase
VARPVPRRRPGGLRAAAFAAQAGQGGRFALAASRLAFCGGFDLEDPGVLAEAAKAAGLPVDECLAAAGDPRLDGPIDRAARALSARGVTVLPAVRTGRRLLAGERMLDEVAPLLRAMRHPAAG